MFVIVKLVSVERESETDQSRDGDRKCRVVPTAKSPENELLLLRYFRALKSTPIVDWIEGVNCYTSVAGRLVVVAQVVAVCLVQ